MFRPRIGQQLLMAIALGLAFLPSVSFASTILQHPFDSSLTVPSTSDVNTLTIANDSAAHPSTVYFGTLDLKNNDLVVQKANNADALTAYNDITDMVRAGYGVNGDWTGIGITSTTTAFDTAHSADAVSPTPGVTGIGVILNDDGTGTNSPIYTTWDGKTVNHSSVLVKYTFLGDTDLDGFVTPFDIQVATASLDTAGGWNNGATTYFGGNVSAFDIQQVVAASGLQSSYPFTSPAAVAFGSTSSVPEPSSIILVVIGAIGAFAIRYRRA